MRRELPPSIRKTVRDWTGLCDELSSLTVFTFSWISGLCGLGSKCILQTYSLQCWLSGKRFTNITIWYMSRYASWYMWQSWQVTHMHDKIKWSFNDGFFCQKTKMYWVKKNMHSLQLQYKTHFFIQETFGELQWATIHTSTAICHAFNCHTPSAGDCWINVWSIIGSNVEFEEGIGRFHNTLYMFKLCCQVVCWGRNMNIPFIEGPSDSGSSVDILLLLQKKQMFGEWLAKTTSAKRNSCTSQTLLNTGMRFQC